MYVTWTRSVACYFPLCGTFSSKMAASTGGTASRAASNPDKKLTESKEAQLKLYEKQVKDNINSMLENFTEMIKQAKVNIIRCQSTLQHYHLLVRLLSHKRLSVWPMFMVKVKSLYMATVEYAVDVWVFFGSSCMYVILKVGL